MKKLDANDALDVRLTARRTIEFERGLARRVAIEIGN